MNEKHQNAQPGKGNQPRHDRPGNPTHPQREDESERQRQTQPTRRDQSGSGMDRQHDGGDAPSRRQPEYPQQDEEADDKDF